MSKLRSRILSLLALTSSLKKGNVKKNVSESENGTKGSEMKTELADFFDFQPFRRKRDPTLIVFKNARDVFF